MKHTIPSLTFLSQLSWLHVWLCFLNVGVFFAALVMGVLVTRRAFFIIALIPLAFIPFSYARVRLQEVLGRVLHTRASMVRLLGVLTGLGMLCDVIMIAQLLTARAAQPNPLLHGPGIAWIGAIWFSAHGLLFLGYMLLRLGQWCIQIVWKMGQGRSAEMADSLVFPERRQFLQHLGVLGAGAPFFISVSNIKLSYDFRVEEREITVPRWPRELDGLRIAHLSDIHVGGAMNRQRLLYMAALTNNAQPDLVVHTGDFLTHRTGNFDAPLYEALARIRAPYGQWACLGNHDFDAPERFVRRLRQAGVATLRDTVVTVSVEGQPLEIAGLDYVFGQREWTARYGQIIRSWPLRTSVPRILLNHDPRAFIALPSGCADLVLSGHTHGGHVGVQLGRDVALTVIGLLGIPDQGMYQRPDMLLYVTRCVGFYGYPMRLGIPPEIALLTIRAPETSPLRYVESFT
ncbi:MAG: metallophosphoesterase [Candidatus Binatia bacterium]